MEHTTCATEHEAVTRLFDLSREGHLDDLEFVQLDSLVYQRLAETYEATGSDTPSESIS